MEESGSNTEEKEKKEAEKKGGKEGGGRSMRGFFLVCFCFFVTFFLDVLIPTRARRVSQW